MANKLWTAEDIEKIWNSTGNGAQTKTAPLPSLNDTSKKYTPKSYEKNKTYTAADIEKIWKGVDRGKEIQAEMKAKANSAPAEHRTVPTYKKFDTRNMTREEEAAYKKKAKEEKILNKLNADSRNNVGRSMGDTNVNRYDSRFALNDEKDRYKNSELAQYDKNLAQVAYTENQNALLAQKAEKNKKSALDDIEKNILDDGTLAAYDAQLQMYQMMPALDLQDQKEIDEINERLRMHEEAKEQLARLNGEHHLVNNQKYNELMSNGRFANDIDTLTTLLHDNSINYGGSVAAQDKRAKEITGGLTMNQYLTQLSKRYELTEAELRDIALTRNYEKQNEVNANNMAEYQRLGEQHPRLGTAASYAGTVGNVLEAPMNVLAGAITDDERRISRGSNIVKTGLREGAKENIDSNVGKILYDVGTGVGDMAVGAALGSAPAVLALNATDSAMLNSLDRGINPRQASLYSTASGITDYFTNKYGLDKAKELAMGSVNEALMENLFGTTTSKQAIKELAKAGLKNNAIAGLGEAGENVVQDIAQSFLDKMINGEDAELNRSYKEKITSGMSETDAFAAVAKEYAAQVGVDALQGYAMGSVMNATHAVPNAINTLEANKLLTDLDNQSQRVWDEIAEEKANGITPSNVNNLPELEKITNQNVKNTRVDNNAAGRYNNVTGGNVNGEGRITNDGTGSNGVLSGIREGESVSQELRGDESQGRGQLQGNSVFSTEELKNNAKAFDDNDVETLKKSKIDSPNFVETNNDAKRFADAFEAARQSNKNGAAVDARDVNNIQEIIDNGGKVFLTDDGTMGFAVEGDGNLTAVFKHDANKTKGMAARATLGAIKNGAFKGDCYGRKLVNMYSMGGFEPVGRMNYEYGFNDAMDAQVRQQLADGVITKEPDVYVLKLRDGYDFNKAASEFNNAKQYSQAELDALPDYTNVENGYDKMLADRDAMIKQPNEVASSLSESADESGRTPYNPTQDMGWAEGSRKYKGVIDPDDVADYGEEYGINGDETKFIKNGQWADGTGSYVLADGSHSNMVFRRGRDGVFYIETLERRPDNYDVKPTNATNTETTEAPTPETTQSSVNPDDFVVQKIRVRGEERYQILKDLHDDAPLERASEFGNLVYKTEKSARRAIQKFIANENAKTERPNEVATTVEEYAARRQAMLDAQQGMNLQELTESVKQLKAMDTEMAESHPEWFRDGRFVGNEIRYDTTEEANEVPMEETPEATNTEEVPNEETVEETPTEEVEQVEESGLSQEDQDTIKLDLQYFAELSEEKKALKAQLAQKGLKLRQKRAINQQINNIDQALVGLRKTIVNTAKNAGIVTDEDIANDPELNIISKYVKHSNAETNERARQNLSENSEQIKKDYISGKSEIRTDLDASQAMMLLKGEYGELDDYERNGILKNLATHGTEAGQFIQSLAQFSNTKEGALINATKVLQDETDYFISRHSGAQENNGRIARTLNNRVAKALRMKNGEGTTRKPMSREKLEESIRKTLENEYGKRASEFSDDDIKFLADLSENKKVELWQIVDEIEHKLEHGEFYDLTEDVPEPYKPKNGKLLSALNALVEGEIREKPEKTFKQIREEVKNTLDEESASFNSHAKGDIEVEFTDSDIDYIAHMIEHGASIADIEDALNMKLATGRFGISDETQAKINELFESAKNYDENSREYVERQAEAFRLLAEEVAPRATPLEKFDAWRYMAMLGNPKTMLRNYIGNKMFSAVTGASNTLAAMLESGTDKLSKKLTGKGIQRTKAILNPIKDKELLEATRQDAYGKRYRQIEGSKYEKMDKDMLRQHRDVFDTRVMRLVEKAIDKGVSDTTAVASKYSTSMAGYMKANGITLDDLQDSYTYDMLNRSKDMLSKDEMQLLDDLRDTASKVEKARDYALKQAEYATFHEDNAIAELLSRASRKGVAGRVIVEGFVPFKKTPANIVRSGVEFSPLGAVKSIAKTGKLIYENTGHRKTDLGDTYKVRNPLTRGTKDVNRTLAADVIESWSQTITGSALASLGYYLYSKGILHSSTSDEKYQDDLEGKQNYSIEINGKTYTIDWAVPGSMPLLLGAEVKKAFDESAVLDEEWYENSDRLFNTLDGLFEPIVETSMLQGIKNTVESFSNNYDNASTFEKVANAATTVGTNYLSQAIPTLSGQIARTVDNTRRSTDTTSDGLIKKSLEKQGRKMMNKIPGLSKLNKPYINARGEKQKNSPYKSGLGRLAYQMLSPAYVSEVDTRDSDKLAREVYDKTRDADVFADWKSQVKLDGKKLNPSEMYDYRKASGKANEKIREALADEDWFEDLPAIQQAEILKNTNSLVKHIGLNAVDDDYESASEAYEAYQNDGVEGVLDYYKKSAFKSQYGVNYNEYSSKIVQSKSGAALLKDLSQYDKQDEWLAALDKQKMSESDKAKVIRAMKGDDIAKSAGTSDKEIYDYYMGKAEKSQQKEKQAKEYSKDSNYNVIKEAGGSDETYNSFQLYSKKAQTSKTLPQLTAKQYMQQVSAIEEYNKSGATNGKVSQQELVDYMRARRYDLAKADEYAKAFFGNEYESYTVSRGDNKGKVAIRKKQKK